MMARARRVALLGLIFASACWGAALSQTRPVPSPTVSPSLSRQQDDARATALLRAAMTAARTNSYVAQVQTIRWGSSGTIASIARIEHLAPDQTHRIYLAPEDFYGDAVVIHGPLMFSYDVKHERVVLSHGPVYDIQTTANDNFGLLVANYRPVLGMPEIIAGRNTLPCSLVNRYTGERVMRLWIDAQTKLVLQKEAYHANGGIGSRVQFEEIRYTRDIPPQVFATPVPSGYVIVKGRQSGAPSTDLERVLKGAGFVPAGPHYLPEGFTIVSADVAMIRNVKTLHLLYSDGLRTLSLFENHADVGTDFGDLRPVTTKVENHDAQYVSDGPTTLLSWKEAGLVFALVGDLDVKELKAIAASVVP